MFNKTVNCWFCNSEAIVSLFRINSWTCKSCNQYNGFKRDGDYNKPIEIEGSNTVKYCTTKNTNANDNKVILCDRCNKYQELKIEKLNAFEPKNENNFDAEFEIYKKKVEEIYDLCIKCKNKLKLHLTQLDREIGKHNSNNIEANTNRNKTKRVSLLNPFNNVTNMIFNGCNQIKNGYIKTAFIEKTNEDIDNKKKSVFYGKANTIAGTVGPYTFENKQKIYDDDNELDKSLKKEYIKKNDSKIYKQKIKYDKKLTKSSKFYHIIISDIIIFMCVLIVFLCDLANLLTDSGQLIMNGINKLATVYKYTTYILNSSIVLSLFVFILRFKLSRLCITTGIVFCSLVHAHIINMKRIEEHYVLELFSSFILTLFLLIARLYNLMQAVAYIKNKAINKINQSLNQSLLNETVNNNNNNTLNETQNQSLIDNNEQKISLKQKTKVQLNTVYTKSLQNNTPPSLKTRLSQKGLYSNNSNIEDSPMQVDTSINDDLNKIQILDKIPKLRL